MVSLLTVYTQLCSEQMIPLPRQKDIKTALRYLASSYGTTPERLSMSETLEATYRPQLQAYFETYPKGKSTIRNSIQAVGQFLKAYHQLTESPSIPLAPLQVPSMVSALHDMREKSPYRHAGWLTHSPYRLRREHWPSDLLAQWDAYRLDRLHSVVPRTLEMRESYLGAYIGYHALNPQARLSALPEWSQQKIQTAPFRSHLAEMMMPTQVVCWDDLFRVAHINSFLTWHSWRAHSKAETFADKKPPSRPSATGFHLTAFLAHLATYTKRSEAAALCALVKSLSFPKAIHDKADPLHQFDPSELEQIAVELMNEARRMTIYPRSWRRSHRDQTQLVQAHPGVYAAMRFMTGLILALGWRNPMRVRNWCEAIIDVNLKHDAGRWRWHFEGDELKVKMRRGNINIFEPEVSTDVVLYLEEYVSHWRPLLPNAAIDQHVFLSARGHPLNQQTLRGRLRGHVYRFTGRLLYPHLLRSLFMTRHLTAGVNINSIAYAMNDLPKTVLDYYNTLIGDRHMPIIAEANQRALANGNIPALTPPVIPTIPKPMKTSSDQMSLI